MVNVAFVAILHAAEERSGQKKLVTGDKKSSQKTVRRHIYIDQRDSSNDSYDEATGRAIWATGGTGKR